MKKRIKVGKRCKSVILHLIEYGVEVSIKPEYEPDGPITDYVIVSFKGDNEVFRDAMDRDLTVKW